MNLVCWFSQANPYFQLTFTLMGQNLQLVDKVRHTHTHTQFYSICFHPLALNLHQRLTEIDICLILYTEHKVSIHGVQHIR